MFVGKDGSNVGTSWLDLGIQVPEGRSGNFKTFCPKCHKDRKHKHDRSLSVNLDNGVAVCKNVGCEERFVIDRLGAIQNRIDRIEKKEYSKPKPQVSYDEVSQAAAKWFEEERGISLSTLKKAQVTTGEDNMPGGKVLPTIRFNYLDEDELINIKYRAKGKIFRMFTGAKLIFYNLNALRNPDKSTIIIVEGEIDALAFIEAGRSDVVSVPNGAQTGNNNMEYLNNCWHLFDDGERKKAGLPPLEKIILALDQDAPGVQLRSEFIRRIGAGKCYFADFGDCKDANQFLLENDKVSLFNVADMATPAPLTDIKTVDDLRSELAVLREKGLHPGEQVGGESFKEHFSFERGRLTILTGIPTHGKSEWLDDVMCRLAIEVGWRMAVFSPENYPIELHIAKLVSKIIGKLFNDCTDMELQEALDFIGRHFIWIDPEEEDFTLDNMFRIADSLIQRYGVDLMIIDPWTEIDTDGKDDTHGVKDLLTRINRYKRRTDLHIVIVAHPTKMAKDEAGRPIVPDLSNISGSAHYYNKTDMGLTIYRDFDTADITLYVNKVKFKHLGKLGRVTMKWNSASGRYQEKISVEMDGWDDSNWLHKSTQTEMNYMPTAEEVDGAGRMVEQSRRDAEKIKELGDDLPF
jgi:twinkle protein